MKLLLDSLDGNIKYYGTLKMKLIMTISFLFFPDMNALDKIILHNMKFKNLGIPLLQ